MLNDIITRRSTRKFKNRVIPAHMLEAVIEAGRYAPSGCNVQQAHFIVVQSRSVLAKLGELVQQEFAKMEPSDDMPQTVKNNIAGAKAGNKSFHYNPQILIIVANSVDNPNAMADTACAIDNMMIMANHINLGSCWINQLRWLQDNEVLIDYLKSIGMKEGEKVYGALSLGFPDTANGMPDRKPLARTGNEVTFVE